MSIVLQRTPAWYAARCGKPTGSQAWRIMAVKKDGSPTAERERYAVELITERMTGSVADRFCTSDMQRGIDLEPAAIRAYEAATGLITTQGSWVDCGTWGCTPDALVESDGILSIKCPRSTTVIRQRFFETEIPQEHYWQVMSEMLATERRWCDIALYDDRFTLPSDRLWIERIPYSEEDGARLTAEISAFLAEIDTIAPPRIAHTQPTDSPHTDDYVGSDFGLPDLGETA